MADLDCRACGACCAAPYASDETYVALEPPDVERLRAVERRRHRALVVIDDDATYGTLRTRETADGTMCVLLRGRIGARVRCSVYDDRPRACRVFARGSDACLTARRETGVSDG